MEQSAHCRPQALLIVLVLLVAGCGTTSQPSGGAPPASQKGAVAPVIGGTQTTVQEPASAVPVAVSHGGPVVDQVSFLDALRKNGNRVQIGAAVQQPFLSVGGTGLTLNTADLQVFEYPDAAATQADLAQLIPVINGTASTTVAWTSTPHAYATGRIIVLYVGDDADTLQRLQGLLGAPQALASPGSWEWAYNNLFHHSAGCGDTYTNRM